MKMNLKTTIKGKHILYFLLVSILFFNACSDEDQAQPKLHQYGVSFRIDGYNGVKSRSTDTETDIAHLFVVAFEKEEDNPATFFKCVEVFEEQGLFSFDMGKEGTFQLFLVANPDDHLVSELCNLTSVEQLETLIITQAPINEMRLFLMNSGEQNIQVTTKKNTTVNPTLKEITLTRLASRFDFYNENPDFKPTSIVFKNQAVKTRFIKTTQDDTELKEGFEDKKFEIKENNSPFITLYGYENHFTDLDKKTSFFIVGELNGGKASKEIILQNKEINQENFLVKRNHRYKITLAADDEYDTYKYNLNFDIAIEEWKEEAIHFVPKAVIHEPHPQGTKPGMNFNEAGTAVTFVLYDKDNEGNHWDNAYLIGDFNDWQLMHSYQMKRDEENGYWWYTLNNIDPTKEYGFQYYLMKGEETLRLADAYSEKILDPWNDKYIKASTYPNLSYPKNTEGIVSVFQAHQPDYNWQVNDFKIEDENNLIIYELLLRDFTQSGDINGALAKLPYLKKLGINAIELMPIQEFDGNDSWGYNPCFYFAMDKAYGTKNDIKRFIDECHKEGIAVILDVVYNHATGSHPFARLYWDGEKNKTASNNPWFNVDPPHQAHDFFHDFNHEELMVRNFIKRNLVFLLEEYKFDGFRFDMSKGFTQKETTSDYECSEEDKSRVHILTDYQNTIKETNPKAIVILEHLCADGEEIWLAKNGMKLWHKACHGYQQAAMGHQEESGFNPLYHKDTESMPFGGYISYMESHDEERIAYKQTQWGQWDLKTNLSNRMKRLATNAAFCFTVPGSKMLWQFGELGYDYSIEYNDRVGRKPIRWEYVNVTDRYNLYNTYSKLIQFRTKNPDLFDEDAEFSWNVTSNDWWWRNIQIKKGDKTIVIVGNFIENEVSTSPKFTITGNWYNLMDNEVITIHKLDQKITVPAHEFRMYVNFNPDNN